MQMHYEPEVNSLSVHLPSNKTIQMEEILRLAGCTKGKIARLEYR